MFTRALPIFSSLIPIRPILTLSSGVYQLECIRLTGFNARLEM
jgi:hypothetical protein